ncbi:dihydroxyacetone kinase family protein [Lacrimispora sp. 38-1]|uniref:dihydroxyacetone kinase family protein n=1 Tax=Lacrimispora sp. 38-1 TaxID=3125778 RepID=UPI003CF74983
MENNMNQQELIAMLGRISKIMGENRDYLIELDSVVGDSDLGLTMSDGFRSAYDSVSDGMEPDLGKMLYKAGKTMGNKVPSTMGTLMAAGFMRAGKVLKGKTELTDKDVASLFQAYEDGVADLGKAKLGEKTFLDGFQPGIDALAAGLDAGISLEMALQEAASAAWAGFENTTAMVAVHGRAATRGEASRSLKDPGAAVGALIMKAVAEK